MPGCPAWLGWQLDGRTAVHLFVGLAQSPGAAKDPRVPDLGGSCPPGGGMAITWPLPPSY